MQVTCPKCETRFRLNSAEEVSYGRMMVCSFCNHEWRYGTGINEDKGIVDGNLIASTQYNRESLRGLIDDIQNDDIRIDNKKNHKGRALKITLCVLLLGLLLWQVLASFNNQPKLYIADYTVKNDNLEIVIINTTSKRIKTRPLDISFYNSSKKVRAYKFTPESGSVLPKSNFRAVIPIISDVTRAEVKLY